MQLDNYIMVQKCYLSCLNANLAFCGPFWRYERGAGDQVMTLYPFFLYGKNATNFIIDHGVAV
jgi:hypothetical protein